MCWDGALRSSGTQTDWEGLPVPVRPGTTPILTFHRGGHTTFAAAPFSPKIRKVGALDFFLPSFFAAAVPPKIFRNRSGTPAKSAIPPNGPQTHANGTVEPRENVHARTHDEILLRTRKR